MRVCSQKPFSTGLVKFSDYDASYCTSASWQQQTNRHRLFSPYHDQFASWHFSGEQVHAGFPLKGKTGDVKHEELCLFIKQDMARSVGSCSENSRGGQ